MFLLLAVKPSRSEEDGDKVGPGSDVTPRAEQLIAGARSKLHVTCVCVLVLFYFVVVVMVYSFNYLYWFKLII